MKPPYGINEQEFMRQIRQAENAARARRDQAGYVTRATSTTLRMGANGEWTQIPDSIPESAIPSDGLQYSPFSTSSKGLFSAGGPAAPDLLEELRRFAESQPKPPTVPSPEEPAFAAETTTLTWDDIAGQHQAKQDMRDAIEMSFMHKELQQFYHRKVPKGVLLYGPPGNGKTMLAKAAATAIGALMGKKGKPGGFLYCKATEFLCKYVGQGEAKIRAVFEAARTHKQAHGVPAVIFIDEADAVMQDRNGRNSFMEKTIVPTFLAEMDGMEDSGAIVILATNRSDRLDPAITRDGRIDRKVYLPRPNASDAAEIAQLYINKIPLSTGTDRDTLAVAVVADLFGEHRVLLRATLKDRSHVNVTMQHTVSGAMLAGLVDRAVTIAFNRDVAAGTTQGTGVTEGDFTAAIDRLMTESKDLNHDAVLHDVLGHEEIIDLKKMVGVPLPPAPTGYASKMGKLAGV